MDIQGFLNNCKEDLSEYYHSFIDAILNYSKEFFDDPIAFINNNGLVFIGTLLFFALLVVMVVNLIRGAKEKREEKTKFERENVPLDDNHKEEEKTPEICENESSDAYDVKEISDEVKEDIIEEIKEENKEEIVEDNIEEPKDTPIEESKASEAENNLVVEEKKEDEDIIDSPLEIVEEVKDEYKETEEVPLDVLVEEEEELKVGDTKIKEEVNEQKMMIESLQKQIDLLSIAISKQTEKSVEPIVMEKVEVVKAKPVPKFGANNMNTTRSGRTYTEEEIMNIIRD